MEWPEGGDDEVFNGGEVWEGALIESGPLDAEITSASKREHSGYRRLSGRFAAMGCRICISTSLFSSFRAILVLTFKAYPP